MVLTTNLSLAIMVGMLWVWSLIYHRARIAPVAVPVYAQVIQQPMKEVQRW